MNKNVPPPTGGGGGEPSSRKGATVAYDTPGKLLEGIDRLDAPTRDACNDMIAAQTMGKLDGLLCPGPHLGTSPFVRLALAPTAFSAAQQERMNSLLVAFLEVNDFAKSLTDKPGPWFLSSLISSRASHHYEAKVKERRGQEEPRARSPTRSWASRLGTDSTNPNRPESFAEASERQAKRRSDGRTKTVIVTGVPKKAWWRDVKQALFTNPTTRKRGVNIQWVEVSKNGQAAVDIDSSDLTKFMQQVHDKTILVGPKEVKWHALVPLPRTSGPTTPAPDTAGPGGGGGGRSAPPKHPTPGRATPPGANASLVANASLGANKANSAVSAEPVSSAAAISSAASQTIDTAETTEPEPDSAEVARIAELDATMNALQAKQRQKSQAVKAANNRRAAEGRKKSMPPPADRTSNTAAAATPQSRKGRRIPAPSLSTGEQTVRSSARARLSTSVNIVRGGAPAPAAGSPAAKAVAKAHLVIRARKALARAGVKEARKGAAQSSSRRHRSSATAMSPVEVGVSRTVTSSDPGGGGNNSHNIVTNDSENGDVAGGGATDPNRNIAGSISAGNNNNCCTNLATDSLLYRPSPIAGRTRTAQQKKKIPVTDAVGPVTTPAAIPPGNKAKIVTNVASPPLSMGNAGDDW